MLKSLFRLPIKSLKPYNLQIDQFSDEGLIKKVEGTTYSAKSVRSPGFRNNKALLEP